ncbi:MAG: YwpF-like family protein [Exiguobacterium sp.]|nr:YwpF-like family protein [Exiguobacterium sp.]MBR2679751.1 YwpF-like family protein [Exiguobacterium sp.]MBR2758993.1 YwpF-like family protein [Exiguobacterium sp.]MBR3063343.1 YwpF-like family protein [Exiguobacterium sp.]
MKTFRLVQVRLVQDEYGNELNLPIDLLDGLIISKEHDSEWLLEMLVSTESAVTLHHYLNKRILILAEAVITSPTNAPAALALTFTSERALNDHHTFVAEGLLLIPKQDATKQVLDSLIQEGVAASNLKPAFFEKKVEMQQSFSRSAFNQLVKTGSFE